MIARSTGKMNEAQYTTALHFDVESVRMHEINTPKRRALVLCGATESWGVQLQTSHLNRR